MISLVLGILNALSAGPFMTAEAATPPPVTPTVDTSGVLDLEQSPEERMVGDGLPATPESGAENPEDLLRSGPIVRGSKKAVKSASAKGTPSASDGMPPSLPLMPAPRTPKTAESAGAPAELPPMEILPTADSGSPASEPMPTSAPADAVVTKRSDHKIPIIDRENPTWGVDIHSSLQALGTKIKSQALDVNGNPTGKINDSDVNNFGMGLEYEPKALQHFGVIDLGPSLNLYFLQPEGDLTKNAFSIYSLGFSVKYQLRFWSGQPIVPFVGYEAQEIHYSFQDASLGAGWTTASGPTFGALIFLNWMEPEAAHNLWSETGIRRSYLVAELKSLTSSNEVLTTVGQAIYFGLRLEY